MAAYSRWACDSDRQRMRTLKYIEWINSLLFSFIFPPYCKRFVFVCLSAFTLIYSMKRECALFAMVFPVHHIVFYCTNDRIICTQTTSNSWYFKKPHWFDKSINWFSLLIMNVHIYSSDNKSTNCINFSKWEKKKVMLLFFLRMCVCLRSVWICIWISCLCY